MRVELSTDPAAPPSAAIRLVWPARVLELAYALVSVDRRAVLVLLGPSRKRRR